MKPFRIKNEILENLLQAFYIIYLENPTFGFFLAHGVFDVKYIDFMYHFGFCS